MTINHAFLSSRKSMVLIALMLSLLFVSIQSHTANAAFNINACFFEGWQGKCPFPPDNFYNVNNCSSGTQSWQFTTRVVNCVQGSIQIATAAMLQGYKTYVPVFMAFALFALILFGVKLVTGQPQMLRLTYSFVFRFALVYMFWYFMVYTDFPGAVFAIVTDFSSLVVGGWSPWIQLDTYLGKIMGSGSNTNFSQGLFGIIGNSLFTGLSGGFVFIIGSLAAITTLYLGFRAIFSYLAALMMIAFLLIISPLVIPLALFHYTERYLNKWLDLLIAAMINPALVFAFLWVFLGLINNIVDTVLIQVLGGNDFSNFWRANNNMISWLMPTDPMMKQQLGQILQETSNPHLGIPPLQTFTSPALSSAVDLNPISSFALDFGPSQVWMMQTMTFHFLGLFLVAYVMLSMLGAIPDIADSIAGVVTGLKFEGLPLIGEARSAINTFKGQSK